MNSDNRLGVIRQGVTGASFRLGVGWLRVPRVLSCMVLAVAGVGLVADAAAAAGRGTMAGLPAVPEAFAYEPGRRDPFVSAAVTVTLVQPRGLPAAPVEETPSARWGRELAQLCERWAGDWVLQGASHGGARPSVIVNGRIVRRGDRIVVPLEIAQQRRLAELAGRLVVVAGDDCGLRPEGLLVRLTDVAEDRVTFVAGGREHGRAFVVVRRSPPKGGLATPAGASRAPLAMMEEER